MFITALAAQRSRVRICHCDKTINTTQILHFLRKQISHWLQQWQHLKSADFQHLANQINRELVGSKPEFDTCWLQEKS